MPLPASNTTWPPKLLDEITPWLNTWSAWYAGDTDELQAIYRGKQDRPTVKAGQLRGGVVGKVSRWFWGAPAVTDLTQGADTRVHVPVAGDICQTSAGLLFSEPVAVTSKHKATQDRLTKVMEDQLHSALAQAAERGSGLGGVYVAVAWDKGLAATPFLVSYDADTAVPEFRHGRLVAVTLWSTLEATDKQVTRHLERHELDNRGHGVILHGLYVGTSDNLGQVKPLAEHPATEHLAKKVQDGNVIPTGSPGLAVAYVPNMRPQRRWRKDPLGCHLGRSDLDGVESLMDQFDATYSSWVRDLDLGKARILVAESVLDDLGAGQGAAFDPDRRIFTPVRALASRQASGLPIEFVQAAIRHEAHAATADALHARIVRSAGYNSGTFGEGPEGGGQMTATEVRSNQARTYLTRDTKVRLWRPEIRHLAQKLLLIDNEVFKPTTRNQAEDLAVTFPDGVQESLLILAQTALAIRTARAGSTLELVRLLHPDWTDIQVKDEARRAMAEEGRGVADPETIGLDGTGLSNSFNAGASSSSSSAQVPEQGGQADAGALAATP